MAAEQQKELLNVSNKVLGAATLLILIFGITFSSLAFDKLFMYQGYEYSTSTSTSTSNSEYQYLNQDGNSDNQNGNKVNKSDD